MFATYLTDSVCGGNSKVPLIIVPYWYFQTMQKGYLEVKVKVYMLLSAVC